MLEALKAFMPVEEQGLGSLSYTSEQRRNIAKNTRAYQCPVCNQKLKDHEELILQNQKLSEQNQIQEIQKLKEDHTRDKEKKQLLDEETRNYYINKSIEEAQSTEQAPSRKPIFGVGPDPNQSADLSAPLRPKKSEVLQRVDSEQDFDESLPRDRNAAHHASKPHQLTEDMEVKPFFATQAQKTDRATLRQAQPRLVQDTRQGQRDLRRLNDMARALQSIVRNPNVQPSESAKDLLSQLVNVASTHDRTCRRATTTSTRASTR